jgi:hypothetical protein
MESKVPVQAPHWSIPEVCDLKLIVLSTAGGLGSHIETYER